MSVELHPPIDEDKGTALARLAADHDGPVMFVGDDVGDLPAFDALDALERSGRTVFAGRRRQRRVDDELRRRRTWWSTARSGVVELLTSLLP